MENTLEKIVAIILVVIMLFVIPLQSMFDRQDDVAYNFVYNQVNQFVQETMDHGSITPERYSVFAESIEAVGLAFDIEVEHMRRYYVPDPNDPDSFLVVYEGFYNMDILNDTLYTNSPSTYYMKKGDYITIQVRSKGKTKAEAMRSILLASDQTGTLFVRIGGMVSNEAY